MGCIKWRRVSRIDTTVYANGNFHVLRKGTFALIHKKRHAYFGRSKNKIFSYINEHEYKTLRHTREVYFNDRAGSTTTYMPVIHKNQRGIYPAGKRSISADMTSGMPQRCWP